MSLRFREGVKRRSLDTPILGASIYGNILIGRADDIDRGSMSVSWGTDPSARPRPSGSRPNQAVKRRIVRDLHELLSGGPFRSLACSSPCASIPVSAGKQLAEIQE